MPVGNKDVVVAFFTALNERNLETAASLVSPEFHHHSSGARGVEGLRVFLEVFLNAFPDIQITVYDVVGDGDRVATRGRWTGTHRGEFMGVPSTDREVEVGFCDIWRVRDGKLVENWVQMDNLGMLVQIGVVPDPAAARV